MEDKMKMTTRNFWRARPLFAMVFASALLSVPGYAQDAATPASQPANATSPQPAQVGPTIKKESRLVLVDAVVTDKKGKYIHDLTKGDFKVYERSEERRGGKERRSR